MRKLSRLLTSLLLISSISGCYKYVYIPVSTCPEPVIPEKPILRATSDLKDTDSILKAIIYDYKGLESYAKQLETILLGYKKQDVPVQPDR